MDLIGIRSLPYLARRNYYYEFKHLIPWGALVGMIEGNAAAIVVVKTFHGSDFLVATASATPIGTLVFSTIWAVLCTGRPKLRLTTIFGALTALFAATVAFTPHTPAGGVIFVIQMAASQIFLCGVVTVRAALWKHNYPAEARGMIAARLQGVRLLMSVGVVAVVSVLFDQDPTLYRYVYPIVAAIGAGALLVLQKLHVRHERTELESPADASAAVGKASLRDSFSPVYAARQMIRLLANDRRYARYMAAQMLLGVSVQLVMPALIVVMNEAAEWYVVNALLIEILPKILMFASLGRWGRLFDKAGVNRFRVYTGTCAAAGLLVGGVATLLIVKDLHTGSRVAGNLALGLFALRAILHGMHQGGGTLAWNLGHLHYSKRHDAELYMGVHQTLTGIRGLTAPFIGVLLWQWIGWGVWGVALLVCLASTWSFLRLAREESPDHRPV